jgi:hypothetical protein
MKLGGWLVAITLIIVVYHSVKFFTTPFEQRPGHRQVIK